MAKPTASDAVANADFDNNVIFREIGAVGNAISWGHIVFRNDLSYIDNTFAAADSAISVIASLQWTTSKTNFKHVSQVNEMTRRARDKLKATQAEWGTYKSTFHVHSRVKREEYDSYEAPMHSPSTSSTEDELDRDRRFLPLIPLGVAALVGGGAFFGSGLGMFNTWQLSQIEGQSTDKEGKQFVISSIQENRERVIQMDAKMADLNYTQQWIVANIAELHELYQVDAYLHDLVEAVREEVSRQMTGLNLLLQKGLSPQLVNATLLQDAMITLKRKAVQHGFVLPIEEVGYLYQLPSSFLSTADGVVSVFIHAPLLQTDKVLTLYEMLEVPIALEGSVHAVQVEPESHLLAMTAAKDGFLIMTDQQLESCQKLGRLHLCADANYLLKDVESYCLTSLFLHRSDAATRTCPTSIVPERTVVRQISQSEFYIFHPKLQTLTIECPADKREHDIRLEFRGARLIDLPPRCFGHSKGYHVSSHEDIYLDFVVLPSVTSWKLGQLLHNLSLPFVAQVLPEPPQRNVPIEDLVTQYWAIEHRQQGYPWHWGLGLSVSTTLILILVAFLVLFLCRSRISRSLQVLAGGDGDPRPPRSPILRSRSGEQRVQFDSHGDFVKVSRHDDNDDAPPSYSPRMTRRSSFSNSLYTQLASAARATGRLSPMLRRAASPLVERGRRLLSRANSSTNLASSSEEKSHQAPERRQPGIDCCGSNSDRARRQRGEATSPTSDAYWEAFHRSKAQAPDEQRRRQQQQETERREEEEFSLYPRISVPSSPPSAVPPTIPMPIGFALAP